jgi:DNA-binding response OmpR family regulator
MAKILLIEDEADTAEAITDGLEFANYTVEWVDSAPEGLQRLFIYDYDLVILDWNIKADSGLALCAEYRARGGVVPILFVTARDAVQDRVAGLDTGADDYLTKPFSLDELLARVSAILRRPRSAKIFDVLTVGDLSLDRKCGLAKVGSKEITLHAKELALLEFFMRHENQFFSAEELLNRLWSSESDSTEQAVRKCVGRLRQKLDAELAPGYIVNIKNLGYKVSKPDAAAVGSDTGNSDLGNID